MVAGIVLTLLLALHGATFAAGGSEGKFIYGVKCAVCHQANGRGHGPYPPLAGNPNVTGADTEQLIATVVNGRTGPVSILGKTYSAATPAWRGELSNAQIAAVLTYIRSAWGNRAPAISLDQIAAAAAPVAFSGSTIFVTTCGNCHSSSGRKTGPAPPLDGNPHVTAADPKAMLAIIVSGMRGPLTVNGQNYNAPMPSWKTRLSNANVAEVATYIRSAWSNRAPAVTEQEVAAAGPVVSAAIGQSIFTQRCAQCHGTAGAASGLKALGGNPRVAAADPTGVILSIEFGRNAMPSWRGQLSNADVAAVATYIRSAWGNKAAPVTEADVAAALPAQ